MVKKLTIVFVILFFPFFCFSGTLIDGNVEVKGAKPTDRLTTLEFNPGIDVIDDSKGLSTNFLTTKFYYNLEDLKYNVGIEIPLMRWNGNNQGLNGLGDILLATNYTGTISKQLLYGLQVELVTPTASKTELGCGRFEISPAAFLEYSFLDGFFIAGGLKYYHSFWGNSDRVDIRKMRIRTNFGYISPTDWWVIVDPKLYLDFEHSRQEFYLEFEGGFMFRGNVAFYLKPGFHAAGEWHSQDWNIQLGIKFFDLI